MKIRRTPTTRWVIAAGLLAAVTGMTTAAGKEAAPPVKVPAAKEDAKDALPKPKRPPDQPILPPTYPAPLPQAIPVTLPEVLKLAVLANLDIVQANLAVERARAALMLV